MSEPPVSLESFSEPVRKLWEKMSPCTLCPRDCKVLRAEGQTGFCGITDMPDMKYADSEVAGQQKYVTSVFARR